MSYSLIGLGNAGCKIVKTFSQYPQYECLYLNTEKIEAKNFFLIPEQNSPERYEQNMPDVSGFLKGVKNDKVILFLGGSGVISACILRILENIKQKSIDVVYIRPDIRLLSGNLLLIERAAFGILQEYARSGVFNRIWIVGNKQVASIVGGLSIKNYYSAINDFFVRAFHFINIFENSEPLFGNLSETKETSRICTLGVYDIESEQERLFYDLEDITEKKLHFAITDNDLENNNTILEKITNKIKDFNEEKNLAEFAIYPTLYEHNFCYTVNFSNRIQKFT